MGIRELYDRERKRRIKRKVTICFSIFFIVSSSLFIYLKGEDIQDKFESDADPVRFLLGNGSIPDGVIASNDPHIPQTLRGKRKLAPLYYNLVQVEEMRVLKITANWNRIEALSKALQPKCTYTINHRSILLFQSGPQAIITPPNKDSITTITLVSPIRNSETDKIYK